MSRGVILTAHFQPLTYVQEALLAQALALAPRVFVGLLGAGEARSARYPFTAEERMEMISRALPPSDAVRVTFVPLGAYAEASEQREALARGFEPGADLTFMAVPGNDEAQARPALYEGKTELGELVSPSVQRFLEAWRDEPPFAAMLEEYRAIQAGRERWGTGPFVTLDALVVSHGHILLVRRGRCPGKGLWALPGSFLEPDEFLLEGALRELQEETTLDLRALGGELKGVMVFDHPERSQRGRTITHVHHFELRSASLPEVKGSDDAAEARWVPLSSLPGMEGQFFEDHFHILGRFFPIRSVGPV